MDRLSSKELLVRYRVGKKFYYKSVMDKEEIAKLVAALHGQGVTECDPHESHVFLPVGLVYQLTDEVRHHKGFTAAGGRFEYHLRGVIRRYPQLFEFAKKFFYGVCLKGIWIHFYAV